MIIEAHSLLSLNLLDSCMQSFIISLLCPFVFITSNLHPTRFFRPSIVTERENHLRGVGKPGGKNQRHRRVHDHHPATAKALRSQLPGHLDWAVRDIVCGVLLCVLPANMERTDHPLAAAAHLPNDVRYLAIIGLFIIHLRQYRID